MFKSNERTTPEVIKMDSSRKLKVEHEETVDRPIVARSRRVKTDFSTPLQTERHAGQLVRRSRHLTFDPGVNRVVNSFREPDLHARRFRTD